MQHLRTITAIGLTTGSAIDDIDAAVIKTDGVDVFETGEYLSRPFTEELREKIRKILGKKPEDNIELFNEVEKELTYFHADIVNALAEKTEEKIDVVGFQGQTIYHNPAENYTNQIGDGKLLAYLTNIPVVNNFITADVRYGGEGAPLDALYYSALANTMKRPVAFVNIGGISSLTYIGASGEIIAFDIGPCSYPIDDWLMKNISQAMDYDGKFGISGKVNEQILKKLKSHKYFKKSPPKSIDRSILAGYLEHIEGLSIEDGAATLTAFAADIIKDAFDKYIDDKNCDVILCGGAVNNPTMVRFIKLRMNYMSVKTANEIGILGDVLEAQAYAYLAARRLFNMPISLPSITGVSEPIIGGELYLCG